MASIGFMTVCVGGSDETGKFAEASGVNLFNQFTGVTAIAAGGGSGGSYEGSGHTLAITSGGAVWAWGENQYGQLGDGTRGDSSIPTPVFSP